MGQCQKWFLSVLVGALFLLPTQLFGAEFQSGVISQIGITENKIYLKITNQTNVSDMADWEIRIRTKSQDKIFSGEVLSVSNNVFSLKSDLTADMSQGIFVEIRDGQGVTIDSINWYGKLPFALLEGQALVRKDISNNLESNWQVSVADNLSEPPATEVVQGKVSVLVNEMLADPVGSDTDGEFVELYNPNDFGVNLDGWKLDDMPNGGSTPMTLSGIIAPKGYLVIEKTALKIVLNNTTDDGAFLYDKTGELVHGSLYKGSEVKEGVSWGRKIDGSFGWTKILTKGEANIFEEATTPSLPVPAIPVVPILEEKPVVTVPVNNPVPTTNPVPAPEVDFGFLKGKIVLGQVFPNPVGDDTLGEFIKITNLGDLLVSLKGWILSTGKKDFVIGTDISLGAKSEVSFPYVDTKLTLTNTGGEVYLYAPDGSLFDKVVYGTAKDGQIYSRSESGQWAWIDPTATGQGGDLLANTQTQVQTTEPVAEESEPNQDEEVSETTIATVDNFDVLDGVASDTELKVKGVVFLPVSTFSSQYFLITDGKKTLKIYNYKKDFPKLVTNDVIEVEGKFSKNGGETKLTYADSSKVNKAGKQTGLKMGVIDLNKVATSDNLVGRLVKVSGVIEKNSGNTFYISNGVVKTLKIYKSSYLTWKKPKMTKGQVVSVSGILDKSQGEYRVLPFEESQIKVAEESSAKTTSDPKVGGTISGSGGDDMNASGDNEALPNGEDVEAKMFSLDDLLASTTGAGDVQNNLQKLLGKVFPDAWIQNPVVMWALVLVIVGVPVGGWYAAKTYL
jgi:hypothetical protein